MDWTAILYFFIASFLITGIMANYDPDLKDSKISFTLICGVSIALALIGLVTIINKIFEALI